MSDTTGSDIEELSELDEKSINDNVAIYQKTFNLQKLPEDLHHRFVEKLRFFDWVLLRQCSNFSSAMCDSLGQRLTLDGFHIDIKKVKRITAGYYMGKFMSDIPWRIGTRFPCRFHARSIRVQTQLTNKKLMKLYKTFYYKEIRANDIFFLELLIDCDVKILIKLAESLDITQLHSHVYFNSEFFNAPIAQQLTTIDLDTCRMTDQQFLSLKADWLGIRTNTISMKAINLYLKEWLLGKRELRTLNIFFESSFIHRSKAELFADIAVNPVWSEEVHETSVFSTIPLEEMRELWDDDPRSFYCMWRSSDLSDWRYIEFNRTRLFVDYGNEGMVLRDLVTEDQFYSVYKVCRRCFIEFCDHRRYYSAARLRRNYPLSWDCFMSLLRLSSLVIRGCIAFTGNFNALPLYL